MRIRRAVQNSAASITLCLWAGSAGAAGPAVAVSPGVNPPSTSTNVSGTGFGTTEGVDVYFDTADEELAVTNASGAFAKIAIPVPASALPGLHWVTAIGRHSGLAAQTPFTVRTDWPQQGYGSQNKAFNPYENVLSPDNVAGLEQEWGITGVAGPPTQYEGRLFVALSADKIAALNPASGATIWSTTFSVPAGVALTEASGLVLFPNCCHAVAAQKASNGAAAWSVTENQQIAGPVTAADGVLYAGGQSGTLFALNVTTGAKLWTGTSLQGGGFGAPTVAKDLGLDYVFAVCNADTVCGLNKTGNLWSAGFTSATAFPPAAMNGTVFFGGNSGNFAAVAFSGRATFLNNQGAFVVAPAAADNVVYAASQTNLYAYNPRSIGNTWSVAPAGDFSSQPAVANGVVYVGDASGVLYAFATATGALLWSTSDTTSPIASNMVVNGMLFATDTNGNLFAYALNAGNNSVYHRYVRSPALASLRPDMSLSPWHHAKFRSADEQ